MTYQPVRNNIKVAKKKKVKRKPTKSEIIKKTIERSKKKHQEYGTSKLEERFAHDFLDKLGVEYQYQYYASDIKRYYDFYLVNERVLIEVDGDFYHGYGKLYEDMSPMQKKNYRVDNIKNEWAAIHSIPLIRIWEHDINNNPKKVMKLLKEWITVATEKMIIENNKKKRH
jgi:very-short-patch-repair endonuclease